MTDIFLSYAMQDREKARRLASVFEQQQWTVFGDLQGAMPGESMRRLVLKELAQAKAVVVLWSNMASASIGEALALGEQYPPAVVQINKNEPPPAGMLVLSFNLSDWDGADSHAELQKLLRHLRAVIAVSSPTADPHDLLDGFQRLNLNDNFKPQQKEDADASPKGRPEFRVFISYRRNEAAAYAGRLYDRLAARFGRERVFIDVENVGWGEDFVEIITSAAESCAAMLVLVSPRWLRGAAEGGELDDYVRLEVAAALGRGIRVVPILIQGATMPAPKELPEDLAPLVRRNALALSDTRWERDVEDLIKSLESLLNN